MQRTLSILLTLLLAAGLAYGIWSSAQQSRVVTVRGLIGSEKEAFFADPAVQERLKRQHKLKTEVIKAGSREMVAADLAGYDFAFPSGTPSAEALRQRSGASQLYDAFYTPLAVASWEPVAGVLEANGLSKEEGGVAWLDMRALLPVMTAGKRWSDLKGSAAYPSKRSLLIGTTDVRKSNSAALYLALVSYLLGGEQPPQASEVPALTPQVSPLFLRQGYQAGSSAGPFEDYLALGAGKSPMVAVYESQYLEKARQKRLPAGSVLLYPSPTIFTKHMLVPLDDAGHRLGKALSTDPELQRLAAQYGFRTPDAAIFSAEVAATGKVVPANLVDLAQEPSQEVTNALIGAIEKQYPQ
ncbi:hypothetical protein ACFP81_09270 [Deinococcus lacus]|uniref:Extracellular solute-binding protein n=1 Tax=Deinococcus lacus TaxID=392561 RepID=A0ABW1YF67_9DEIO